MAKQDLFVKRFKALSLTIFAATLLTYDVFESGRSLGRDFQNIEQLFYAASLVEAHAPSEGSIDLVGDMTAKEWLDIENSTPPLPTKGGLADLIRLWDKTGAKIVGTLRLSNSESVEFVRLAFDSEYDSTRSSETYPESQLRSTCGPTFSTACQYFAVDASAEKEPHKFHLIYLPINPRRTSASSGPWLYSHDNAKTLVTLDEVRSQIVQTASEWTSTPSDAESAYFATREKLTQRTVQIPIVGVNVKASKPALYFSLFAFVVSVLMAHCTIAIASMPVHAIDEPWVVLVNSDNERQWETLFQIVTSIGASAVLSVILWCPVIMIFLSILMAGSTMVELLQYTILITTILVTLISTSRFWSILSQVHRHHRRSRRMRLHHSSNHDT